MRGVAARRRGTPRASKDDRRACRYGQDVFRPAGSPLVAPEKTFKALQNLVREHVGGTIEDMKCEHLHGYTLKKGCDCVVMHANGVSAGRPEGTRPRNWL